VVTGGQVTPASWFARPSEHERGRVGYALREVLRLSGTVSTFTSSPAFAQSPGERELTILSSFT